MGAFIDKDVAEVVRGEAEAVEAVLHPFVGRSLAVQVVVGDVRSKIN